MGAGVDKPLTAMQARAWVAMLLRTESDALCQMYRADGSVRTDEDAAEGGRLWDLAKEVERGLNGQTRAAAHRRWWGQ